MIYVVVLPCFVALLTVLLRGAGRKRYVAAAVSTAGAVYTMILGFSLAGGNSGWAAVALGILFGIPVLPAFWVAAWDGAREHVWLAFVVVPLAFWAALYPIVAVAIDILHVMRF